jgi:serine/threonine protein kinase
MIKKLGTGDKIDRYEILSVLEKDDISIVYLARENENSQKVIIREINPPKLSEEFLKEFKNDFFTITGKLAEFEHKSIHKVETFFVLNDDRFFIVRNYLEGRSLETILRENLEDYLDEEQVKMWTIQICDALEYMHSRETPVYMGVLVPENISISPLGTLRFRDSGIARYFPPEQQRNILMKHYSGYIAPEIFENDQLPDVRSEIYTLGVLLYHLLTGHDPNKNPFFFKDISELRPDISGVTRKAIMKAIDPEPENRFNNIREFRDALMIELLDRNRTKIRCSIDHIAYEDVNTRNLIQGEFDIQNVGQGCLEGTITTEYPWLKTIPNRFFSNKETIRYLVDTTYMQPDRSYENSITLKTIYEEVKIPVRVCIYPGYMRSLKNVSAAFLLLLIPLVFFVIAEAFRYLIIRFTWSNAVTGYDFFNTGIDFTLLSRELAAKSADMAPVMFIYNKLYALLMILMPYFVPLAVGKTREKLNPEIQKKTTLTSAFAMMLPTIILLVMLYLNVVPLEITTSASMRYLDPARYLPLLIPANILAAFLMIVPKDYQGQSIIDKSGTVKGVLYFALTLYFIAASILLVFI